MLGKIEGLGELAVFLTKTFPASGWGGNSQAKVLGWPKSLFEFFCTLVWETRMIFFGQFKHVRAYTCVCVCVCVGVGGSSGFLLFHRGTHP